MRRKLKALNLRLTELANSLKVSRPTLYKYLELFEKRKYKKIDPEILDVFKYIMREDTVSKLQILNYISENNMDNYKNLNSLMNELDNTYENEQLLIEVLELFKDETGRKMLKKTINKYREGDSND